MKILNFNKIVAVWLLVFGLLLVAVICNAGVIHINSENTVTSDTIYVKDLANIDASDTFFRKIGDIKIGTSPKPGKKKKIPASLIESRILSATPADGLEIMLPEGIVTVTREYQVISEEALKEIFREYVEDRLEGEKIKITGIKIKRNKKFSKGKLSLNVAEVKDNKISGHFKMIVNAKPETGKISKILISGWVERYDDVVYAKNEIRKGQIIKENSLYTELTNITKYPPDLVKSLSLVTGQIAKTKIRKNMLIRQKMIGRSPDVKKGEMVKMKANSGLLTVVTIGLAIDDARIGEQIRVRNIKSKKIITGVVLDSKTVAIVF